MTNTDHDLSYNTYCHGTYRSHRLASSPSSLFVQQVVCLDPHSSPLPRRDKYGLVWHFTPDAATPSNGKSTSFVCQEQRNQQYIKPDGTAGVRKKGSVWSSIFCLLDWIDQLRVAIAQICHSFITHPPPLQRYFWRGITFVLIFFCFYFDLFALGFLSERAVGLKKQQRSGPQCSLEAHATQYKVLIPLQMPCVKKVKL